MGTAILIGVLPGTIAVGIPTVTAESHHGLDIINRPLRWLSINGNDDFVRENDVPRETRTVEYPYVIAGWSTKVLSAGGIHIET